MSKYLVYATTNNGSGMTTRLPDWDDEESSLEISLSAFARDVVITIEPDTEQFNEVI